MWLLLLTLLILLPLFAYWFTRHYAHGHRFWITGTMFGAVVSPWALGLYSCFFLSPFGVIPGFLGLVLVLIREPPGFELAVHFGVLPRGEIVSGITQHLIVETINAVVWSVCYGVLGYTIGRFPKWKKTASW